MNPLLVGITTLIFCSACTTKMELHEPLQDTKTHEIFSLLQPPLTFANSTPQLSATGRDLVYLMPLRVSRNGHTSVYLWIGITSTIDRGVSHAQALDPSAIRLVIRGEELNFPLVSWQSPVFKARQVGVPIQYSARSALPWDDLRAMFNNNPESLTLLDEAGNITVFHHWTGLWELTN